MAEGMISWRCYITAISCSQISIILAAAADDDDYKANKYLDQSKTFLQHKYRKWKIFNFGED